MKKIVLIYLILLLSCLHFDVFAKSDSIPLPKPTGEFPIGTMTYYWKDHSRSFSFSEHEKDPRIVPVHIWYPGERGSNDQRAPYAGLISEYQLIQTNSYIRLPFNSKPSEAPVIILVPGRGIERFAYTQIAEELASHGFVVVSIDMPEIGYLVYPDGYVIQSSEKFNLPDQFTSEPNDKDDALYKEVVELGMEDLKFVIKRLDKLNLEDPEGRFTGKLNINNVGIFGHSLGGRIAGAFSSEEKSIKAFASMEGLPPGDVIIGGKINAPSLLLCSSGTWRYAEKNYSSFIENRKSKVHVCELIDFGNNSLTDGPYLFSRSYKYSVDPFMAIEIGRKLLLDFFNEELYGKGSFGAGLGRYIKIKHKKYQ